jgi:hypothetical protein
MILKLIYNNLDYIVYNHNGLHIVNTIITCFQHSKIKFIIDYILENLIKIATNVNGICVLKKLLLTTNDYNIKKLLISKFSDQWLFIIKDTYGNYAFQTLIETWDIELIDDIIKNICDNIVNLSVQRYSSCVVEKCLQYLDEARLIDMIEKVFNKSNFDIMFRSKYGYFVLIKAATLCPYYYKKIIRDRVLVFYSMLNCVNITRFNTILSIL